MNESVHKGVSPSIEREKQIIDRNPRKWESVLLHLVFFAILLPTAAQSMVAGLLGLSFLIPRGWRTITWLDPIPQLFLKLLKTLFLLWAVFILSGIAESVATGQWNQFMPYLRLIGKQGVWGGVTIAAFIYYQSRSSKPWLNPRALLLFSSLLLIYSIFQRSMGLDWVHGFNARLPDNRQAYGVFRVSGWMDHPLTFAFNLMLFILLSFSQSLYVWKRGEKLEARFWALHTFILGLLLLLTDSRFPILLTLSVILIGLAWEFPKLRRLLVAGAILGILTLVLVFSTLPREMLGRWGELIDPNMPWEQRFDRVIFWKINWRLFTENPWFGTGLNRYPAGLLDTYLQAGYTSLERKYNAHNIYLQTLTDSGLLGGIGLAILLTAVGRLAFAVKKRFDHIALPLIFLATLGGGLVQNHLRDTEYLYALWTSIGLSLSWLLVQGNKNEPRAGGQLQDNQP